LCVLLPSPGVFADVAEAALKSTPLFNSLELKPLRALSLLCVLETVEPATPIFREGDEAVRTRGALDPERTCATARSLSAVCRLLAAGCWPGAHPDPTDRASPARLVAVCWLLARRSPRDTTDRDAVPQDSLYILLNGAVEVVKDGVTMEVLDGAGADNGGHPFFGAAGCLEHNAHRPWDVHARTPCNMLLIPMKKFRAFLKGEPDFKTQLEVQGDTRRRQWELQTGLALPYIHAQEVAPAPEPAPPVGSGRRTSVSPEPRRGGSRS
jgi:hypothetical protein